jgi:hypothetical protein
LTFKLKNQPERKPMTPRSNTILKATCLLALTLIVAGFMALISGGPAAIATLAFFAVGISVSYATAISSGGISISGPPILRTGSGGITLEETLVVGTAATLSTRASDVAGTLTVATGHAVVTGDVIDVLWDIGGVKGVAYKCTVGTVAAAPSDTSIPFTLASGDVLPVVTSPVVMGEVLVANVTIDGDNTKILSVMLSTTNTSLRTGAHIQFQDAANDEIAEIDLVTNVPQVWDITGGSANPFTGDVIATARIGNGGSDSTETYTLKMVGVQDASP